MIENRLEHSSIQSTLTVQPFKNAPNHWAMPKENKAESRYSPYPGKFWMVILQKCQKFQLSCFSLFQWKRSKLNLLHSYCEPDNELAALNVLSVRKKSERLLGVLWNARCYLAYHTG